MISGLYASFLALLLAWLSVQVITLRRAKKVRLGDGGDPQLLAAVRAHGNATEYIPICLLLLALLEMGGAHAAMLHAGGAAVLGGRLLHANGMLKERLRHRILGMQITIYTLIALALANLGYASLRLLSP